jgi:RNA-splicing ligase RtcB
MGTVFGKDPRELGLSVVYDVCHNTAKLEQRPLDGTRRRLNDVATPGEAPGLGHEAPRGHGGA